MKRDDETLLEYLIRLAKEGGEGLQDLGAARLKKARPDVAARRGLLDDEVVEEAVIDEPFPFQQLDGPRPFEEPQPLQEWTGSGAAPEPDPALMQRMLTQPGQTDIAREQWTGAGPLPGETQSLMDLDQSMTGMREQPAQQDLPSPLTARMPAADLDLSPIPSVPGTGDPAKETELETSLLDKYRGATQSFLNEQLPDPEEASDKTLGLLERAKELGISIPKDALRANTGFEDLLKGIMGARGSTLAGGGIGAELMKTYLGVEGVEKPDFKKLATESVDLGVVASQVKEKLTGEKVEKSTDWVVGGNGALDSLLGEEVTEVETSGIKKAPTDKKQTIDQSIEQAKKNTGSSKRITTTPDKPTYFGHTSKEEFLRAAGILGGDKKSKDFTGRMDKIDSESKMFDMIAMLGGAGNSNAGKNFRNKSYQRLKLESDIDEREWDRQFRIMSHPWDTWYWYDPEAGIKPISRPRGMGMGEGWQQQPTARDKGTPQGRNFDSLLAMWDGSPRSEELMRIRFINEFIPAGMFLDTDGQNTAANNFLDVAFPLPKGGKRWTSIEVEQAKLAISKGSKEDIIKILKVKNYIPPELIAAIKELLQG